MECKTPPKQEVILENGEEKIFYGGNIQRKTEQLAWKRPMAQTQCPRLQMSIRVTWETSQNTDALGPREHRELGFLEVYHTTSPQKLTPVSGVLWELLSILLAKPSCNKGENPEPSTEHAEGWQFCFLSHVGKYKVRVSTSDEDVSEASLNAATHSPVPSYL